MKITKPLKPLSHLELKSRTQEILNSFKGYEDSNLRFHVHAVDTYVSGGGKIKVAKIKVVKTPPGSFNWFNSAVIEFVLKFESYTDLVYNGYERALERNLVRAISKAKKHLGLI